MNTKRQENRTMYFRYDLMYLRFLGRTFACCSLLHFILSSPTDVASATVIQSRGRAHISTDNRHDVINRDSSGVNVNVTRYCWIAVDAKTSELVESCAPAAAQQQNSHVGRRAGSSSASPRAVRSPAVAQMVLDKSHVTGRRPVFRQHRTNMSGYPDNHFDDQDAAFLNKGEREKKLAYGHDRRLDGRLPNSVCDWLIVVDECVGYCQLVSPGYPSVYPSNSRCTYLITSYEDSRVELLSVPRKFDIRSSPGCHDDYIAVYDGPSTNDHLIGQFCGRVMPHLVSTGPSLYVVFHTSSASSSTTHSSPSKTRSKQHTYGFLLHTLARWRNHHEGGRRVIGTTCDWTFSSIDTVKGELHTPDSPLYDNDTRCVYEFYGVDDNERIELVLFVSGDTNGQLLNRDDDDVTDASDNDTNSSVQQHCNETLSIYNDYYTTREPMTSSMTICVSGRTAPAPLETVQIGYNSTGNQLRVVYRKLHRQLSNPDPTWIYFRFWRTKVAAGMRREAQSTSLLTSQSTQTEQTVLRNIASSSSVVYTTLRKCWSLLTLSCYWTVIASRLEITFAISF